jgi:hypothetical protein
MSVRVLNGKTNGMGSREQLVHKLESDSSQIQCVCGIGHVDNGIHTGPDTKGIEHRGDALLRCVST